MMRIAEVEPDELVISSKCPLCRHVESIAAKIKKD